MQVHILGGGAIGQLFAFHLTKVLRTGSASASTAYLSSFLPPSDFSGVTVHIRSPGKAQKLNDAGGSVTLDRQGRLDSVSGIAIQGGLGALPGSTPSRLPEGVRTTGLGSTAEDRRRWQEILNASATHQLRVHEVEQRDLARSGLALFEPDRGPQAHIDTLFLCTKADTASFALEGLLPRLSSRSTLVLTQNGLGLADLLIARHFPDPAQRPFIILSSLTHGLYRSGLEHLQAVHASQGEIYFGVLPDLRLQTIPGGLERRAPWPAQSNNEGQHARWPAETLSLEHIHNHFAANVPSNSSESRARNPALGPPTHEASSLIHTIALLLGAEELKASWIPLPDFHRRALRKLAINACINPLTAMLECQNGALIGASRRRQQSSSQGGVAPASSPAQTQAEIERGNECVEIMRDVCSEISAVVQERALRSWQSTRHHSALKEQENSHPASWSAADVLDFTPREGEEDPSTSGAVGSKIDLEPRGLINSADLANDIDAPPSLHRSLTADALYSEVLRVLEVVRDNYSSMYQDVVLNGRASSEIGFVNGYVRRLADVLNEELESAVKRGQGKGCNRVDVPINRMLERLVAAKCDLLGSLGRSQHAHPEASAAEETRPTRSPSFPIGAGPPVFRDGDGKKLFDASAIKLPMRERVGYKRNRVGGYGRLWELRHFARRLREKEQARLERLKQAKATPNQAGDHTAQAAEEASGEEANAQEWDDIETVGSSADAGERKK